MNAVDTRETEIARYVTAVEAALSDLPPRLRGDLVADLVEHLTEVAVDADGDTPLAERVGSPESYAAELRATVDTELARPLDAEGRDTTRARDLLELRERVARRVGAQRAQSRSMTYSARTVWWVLRGGLFAQIVVIFTMGGRGYLDLFLRPSVVVLGAVYFVMAAASVHIGRTQAPWARTLGVVLNVLAAFVVLFFYWVAH